LLGIAAAALFVIGKGLRTGNGIQIENHAGWLSQIRTLTGSVIRDERTALRGEDDGRINILLLGRAGTRYPGRELTDTVMLMSIDTEEKRVALLSLPRDLYAPIPDTDLYTKLNSLYQYGLSNDGNASVVRASVEEITGQEIQYFATLDFDGFEKAIDAIGGISVDVVRDFHDERYPGKNYSYETFDIKKGWQTLDGATALKYVRERHNDPEGDFGRAKRQQQVLQAVRDKTFSAGTFLNAFAISDLLDALGESVRTDMSLDEMKSFLELSRTIDTKNISTAVIDAWKKDSLLRVSHVQVGPVAAFILVPRVGDWSEIRDVAAHVFDLGAIRERQARIGSEQPTLSVLYASDDVALARKLSGIIDSDLPFEDISLSKANSLENHAGRSIIVDRSGGKKPYSLDELMKRFGLGLSTSLPAGIVPPSGSDFIIVIGADMADRLDFDENASAENLSTDDSAFPEMLPPQKKKR
jgi:LCP family protein required for cell wall assembly